MSKKIFVLDTNVLIHDPNSIESFEEHDVVIPIQVIEELDKLEHNTNGVGYDAREAQRAIEVYEKKGNIGKGVKLPGGGIIRFHICGKLRNFKERTADNFIISTAIEAQMNNKGRKVILVSKDRAVRFKTQAAGVAAEDYKKDKTSLFQNYGKVLSSEDYNNGILSVRYQVEGEKICRKWGKDLSEPIRRGRPVYGLHPRNSGQECAIDALTNPNVELVALAGIAGSGKTLLALAAALFQTTKHDPLFKRVVVARPIVFMGEHNDLGFLPGDLGDKLAVWMRPIEDNLDVLHNTLESEKDNVRIREKGYQQLLEQKILQFESVGHIRGRSLPQSYIIIDEAQNLRPPEVKTIITRAGENTKIVFTGDLAQVDTPYLDPESNGLANLIAQYINEPEFCYLNLPVSARSTMADKAARLL